MAALTGGLLAAPLGAVAQQAGKVYSLGYLAVAGSDDKWLNSLRQSLSDLGYLEGRNIVWEIRYAERNAELPDLAAGLLQRNMDLIVAGSGLAAMAAKKVTQTIPIVMLASGDPVRQGLIASLPRPG